jgi:hypothetical protein
MNIRERDRPSVDEVAAFKPQAQDRRFARPEWKLPAMGEMPALNRAKAA